MASVDPRSPRAKSASMISRSRRVSFKGDGGRDMLVSISATPVACGYKCGMSSGGCGATRVACRVALTNLYGTAQRHLESQEFGGESVLSDTTGEVALPLGDPFRSSDSPLRKQSNRTMRHTRSLTSCASLCFGITREDVGGNSRVPDPAVMGFRVVIVLQSLCNWRGCGLR